MKLVNKTCYVTKHLRAFVVRIAKKELTVEQRRRLRFEFVPAKQQYSCSGRGSPTRVWAKVRIPTKASREFIASSEFRRELCSCIAHELHHASGRDGGRENEYWMRRSVPYGRPDTDEGTAKQKELYSWTIDLPLEKKEKKAKMRLAGSDLDVKKIVKIETTIQKWNRKFKLAQTRLKGYRRKLAYYERKVKIAATPAGESQ